MDAEKPEKKPHDKKGDTPWVCPNPGKAYDLTTLVDMLVNTPGFANFLFPVIQGAMANNPDCITCLQSYLYPEDSELEALGVPPGGVGGKRKCTDVGMLVAVVAQKYA
ncbi:MAG: hypothetical protein DMF06_12720 [Verrucomicrobia bacterium]|nr:MAG: hypothetical protein DMF06_12720 [Verrucomicrobiota bacterium]